MAHRQPNFTPTMPRLENAVHEKFAQLLALRHLSQHAAWVEAVGPVKAAKTKPSVIAPVASRLAKNAKIATRIEEIQAENERECRWGRCVSCSTFIAMRSRPALVNSSLMIGFARASNDARDALQFQG